MRGRRAVFRCALVRGTRYSVAAAASTAGILDYIIVNGSCTGHIFFRWFITSLYFQIPDGAILVLDNASVHRYAPFIALVDLLGVRIIYLPPYSPFLNPVEHIWVAVKCAVRRYRTQILQDPETALAAIMDHYTNFNVEGSMRSMGYHYVMSLH